MSVPQPGSELGGGVSPSQTLLDGSRPLKGTFPWPPLTQYQVWQIFMSQLKAVPGPECSVTRGRIAWVPPGTSGGAPEPVRCLMSARDHRTPTESQLRQGLMAS